MCIYIYRPYGPRKRQASIYKDSTGEKKKVKSYKDMKLDNTGEKQR